MTAVIDFPRRRFCNITDPDFREQHWRQCRALFEARNAPPYRTRPLLVIDRDPVAAQFARDLDIIREVFR